MKKITKRKPTFLIAEIGINHNGSVKLAKKLINLAKKYNFDAVKFQKRDPNISTPDLQKSKMRDTPWGYMSYLDYKKKIEFNEKEFQEINNYCKKIKIDWFCSAWDINSQIFLKKFDCKYNKIASSMLTNTQLLKVVAKEKKHTFISTGMSNLKNISDCVKIFKKNKCKYTLLHCVSTYPCPEEDLNLNMIVSLKKIFKCPVGYSGHESSVTPSLMAVILGAEVIERHITLNRAMWGTDQSASLEKAGINNLSSIISKVPSILGSGKKIFSSSEKKMLIKFKYW
jgi:N-acetylneuraminate synthase